MKFFLVVALSMVPSVVFATEGTCKVYVAGKEQKSIPIALGGPKGDSGNGFAIIEATAKDGKQRAFDAGFTIVVPDEITIVIHDRDMALTNGSYAHAGQLASAKAGALIPFSVTAKAGDDDGADPTIELTCSMK